MSSTWIPGPVRSLPLSPVMNPFVTPPPRAHDKNGIPDRVATPDQPRQSRYPPPPPPSPRTDKGKGRQSTTPAPSSSSTVDTSSTPTPSSPDLTPEQHVRFVRMLKCLDEWISRGWEPGVDKSRLRHLAEIFNAAEAVAEGGLADLRLADLAWRLADSEGWEKSAGSSIMGAIDIQVTVTKILYKDYGDELINSFRSFLEESEASLGNCGRPSCVAGSPSFRRGFDSPGWTAQMEDLVSFSKVGMQAAEHLLKRRLPAYRRMMKRAGVSPNISVSLARRLMADGETSFSLSDSPLPVLTPSAPSTPLLRSLTNRSSPLPPVLNFGISSPVAESSLMPTLSADTGVSAVTPSDTGHPTMTELVNQYMEDLLTQEFSLVPTVPDLLDEDI
ncbi:hypothetical protein SCLCIDRAFT_34354 [Scleroderma citrinum Foug A]|uniref:Uncharacterized protein n=1 Tax=Scleroderma citrinum Foug A TaxID=1036808 RepID=A0A0C2ZBE1_9AGAM|nr:hypothetical protein SCLCIDRAFT_34354 [Scleroderma citrinum Foug A]